MLNSNYDRFFSLRQITTYCTGCQYRVKIRFMCKKIETVASKNLFFLRPLLDSLCGKSAFAVAVLPRLFPHLTVGSTYRRSTCATWRSPVICATRPVPTFTRSESISSAITELRKPSCFSCQSPAPFLSHFAKLDKIINLLLRIEILLFCERPYPSYWQRWVGPSWKKTCFLSVYLHLGAVYD